MRVSLLVALFCGVVIPCAGAREPEFSKEVPAEAATALTQPVRILADSQLHEFYGAPTFAQSSLVDKLVEVAVRPSQQRLFAPDLLLEAVTGQRTANELLPVIHLGDAIDVGCTSEWARFDATLRATGRPWFLAPGNHDGYFLGNLLPPVKGKSSSVWSETYGSEGWIDRCAVGPVLDHESALSKPDLLQHYVSSAYGREVEWPRCGGDKCLSGLAGPQGLRRVEGLVSARRRHKGDPSDPWTSFLLQEIDISAPSCTMADAAACPRVSLMLLDTSQYSKQPMMLNHPAGTAGSVLETQMRVAEHWEEEQRQASGLMIFAGHHPLSAFADGDRDKLLKMMCRQTAPLYISAHTHSGYWRKWKCEGQNKWVAELNLGSVLDWEPHFRMLTVYRRADGSVVYSAERKAVVAVGDQSVCPAEWLPGKGSERTINDQQLPLDIATTRNQQIEAGRRSVLAGLRADLREYRALLMRFPTSEGVSVPGTIGGDADAIAKIDARLARLRKLNVKTSKERVEPETLLADLAKYEAARTVPDREVVSRYKRCLGAWAAREDYARQHRQAAREADASRGLGANTLEVGYQAVSFAAH